MAAAYFLWPASLEKANFITFCVLFFFLLQKPHCLIKQKQTDILQACLLNMVLVSCHYSRSETLVDSRFCHLYTYQITVCSSSLMFIPVDTGMKKQELTNINQDIQCI